MEELLFHVQQQMDYNGTDQYIVFSKSLGSTYTYIRNWWSSNISVYSKHVKPIGLTATDYILVVVSFEIGPKDGSACFLAELQYDTTGFPIGPASKNVCCTWPV